jgi:hypothetical protein
MQEDITHREIYERLLKVETEINHIREDTKDLVSAFNAASGAFTALEWIAKVAKPVIYIVTLIAAVSLWFKGVNIK